MTIVGVEEDSDLFEIALRGETSQSYDNEAGIGSLRLSGFMDDFLASRRSLQA